MGGKPLLYRVTAQFSQAMPLRVFWTDKQNEWAGDPALLPYRLIAQFSQSHALVGIFVLERATTPWNSGIGPVCRNALAGIFCFGTLFLGAGRNLQQYIESVAMPLRAFFVLELALGPAPYMLTEREWVAMPLRAFFVLELACQRSGYGYSWYQESQCPCGDRSKRGAAV